MAGFPAPGPGRVGHRLRVAGLGPHRQQQVGPQFGRPRAAQRVRAAQYLPVRRVAGQVITERGAGAEHRGEPASQPRVGAQGGEQVPAERHPGQCGQGQIRVGGGGQRGQQVSVGALGIEGQILAEQPFRPVRVSESHPGQLPGRGCPSARTHPCTVTAGCHAGFPWPAGRGWARVTGADTAARGLRRRRGREPEGWNRGAGPGGWPGPPVPSGLKSPAPGPSVDGPGRGVHRGG